MEDENKCFFSISLENGITITGNDPEKVRKFLMNCATAFFDCRKKSEEQNYQEFAKIMQEYENAVLSAARTIKKNYKH